MNRNLVQYVHAALNKAKFQVKTILGNRSIVMEEQKTTRGQGKGKDYKISCFEDDKLQAERETEIDLRIPSNMVLTLLVT